MNKKVLVLGLGNILQTDEGIGVHVINYIRERGCIRNAEIVDGGTHSFSLSGPIEEAEQMVVIDTAELNAPPGSIQVFEGMEMDAFVAHGKKSSAHEIGLKDALSMALLNGKLPPHRALIGIQPEKFGWGEKPTKALEKAIPRACQKAFEITENWKI
jgi:hydrogenase maturation protease